MRAPQTGSLDQPIADVSWPELALAAGLVLIAIGISRRLGAGLERSLLVGALRTVVQLSLVGYVLVFVFTLDRWYVVVGALFLMVAVAGKTAADRQERGTGERLLPLMTLALLVGSGLTLAYVSVLVVRPDPWYDPRYLIPLFGMIVGNAMNGAALAAERLDGEMRSRAGEVEAALALGASPARAAAPPVQAALRAAMIPTVNSLMVVGIVSLPGMMTGQIIAGASPLLAVRYQIVVMFMLAAAVALSALLVILWRRRRYFTPAEQLERVDRRGER